MSTFDTRMANHPAKVKTASVWRKLKAVLAILATALGTIGLITVPAAPAHADWNCDQWAFNGDYAIWQPPIVNVGFPAPWKSQNVKGGKAWETMNFPWGKSNIEGNLEYAVLKKDPTTGTTTIMWEIRWSPNSLVHYEGTVVADGSAFGWDLDKEAPSVFTFEYWYSLTPLGCYTPGEQTSPAPCNNEPPQPSGEPYDLDFGLLDLVNVARKHPENYPPHGDDTAGAWMDGCCQQLTWSDSLSNLADTHNQYIRTQSDAWLNDPNHPENAHRNAPPDPLLSADVGGRIYQEGYTRWMGEIVAWDSTTIAPPPPPDPYVAVRFWMQDDAKSQWGHRNAILSCGQHKDVRGNYPDFHEAGAAHYPMASRGDPPGDETNYWTVDFGTRP